MNRIKTIRQEEKKYHDACYENYRLFEEGSWLHRPVQSVMEGLGFIKTKGSPTVLDLGCGVGRNSIPLASIVKEVGGKVVCVDLLDSALQKLMSYSKENDVEHFIIPVKQDIGRFLITQHEYDYIVAISSLEHVESEETLDMLLVKMAEGTKAGGVNCLIVNSDVEEVDMETGEQLEAFIEVNLPTDTMLEKLQRYYTGWEVLKTVIKPLAYPIERSGRSVLLKTNAITFVGRKVQNFF